MGELASGATRLRLLCPRTADGGDGDRVLSPASPVGSPPEESAGDDDPAVEADPSGLREAATSRPLALLGGQVSLQVEDEGGHAGLQTAGSAPGLEGRVYTLCR